MPQKIFLWQGEVTQNIYSYYSVLMDIKRFLSFYLFDMSSCLLLLKVLTDILKKVNMFNENYMILPEFVDEASRKIESIIRQSYMVCVHACCIVYAVHAHILQTFCSTSTDSRLADRRVLEAVWMAMEE